MLTQGAVNQLQVCPALHTTLFAMCSRTHLVVLNDVADAAVVETRLEAADGNAYEADVFTSIYPESLSRNIRVEIFTW